MEQLLAAREKSLLDCKLRQVSHARTPELHPIPHDGISVLLAARAKQRSTSQPVNNVETNVAIESVENVEIRATTVPGAQFPSVV